MAQWLSEIPNSGFEYCSSVTYFCLRSNICDEDLLAAHKQEVSESYD